MSKFRLNQTCGACPEQYDVYRGDEQVGYLRLRHGYFRAEAFVNCERKTVYEAYPRGDGIFQSEERDFYLNQACKAIADCLAAAEAEVEAEELLFEFGPSVYDEDQ
jgi:hypothetical protein